MRNEWKYKKFQYKGFEIWIGRGVRNHSDATHGMIVMEVHGNSMMIIKRYSKLVTIEDEQKAFNKAKKFIDERITKQEGEQSGVIKIHR